MMDFWIGVLGNIVASAILGSIAWFWKIRPHFRRVHARLDVQDAALGITHS